MANDLIHGEGAGKPAPSTPDTSLWMYRGQEGRLFASKADIPEGEGWKDAPHDLAPAPALVAEPEKPKSKRIKAEPVKDIDGNSDGN